MLNSIFARLSRRTTSGTFLPEVDGLRFVSIALVFLFHVGVYLTVKSARPFSSQPGADWLSNVAAHGAYGVQLFFVISGFILGVPFAKHWLAGAPPVRLRAYFLRRITRLEPPYILSLIGFFALLVVVNHQGFFALLPHLAAGLVYLHTLIFGTFNPVNGVTWSLEIEVQFYILAPVLAWLFRIRNTRRRWFVELMAIVVAIAIQQAFIEPKSRMAYTIVNFAQYFLAGFFVADLFVAAWKERPTRTRRWDLVSLFGWPLLFLIWNSSQLTAWLFAPLAIVLFCAAFRGELTSQLFSNRWVTTIGGMCYTIYLIHYQLISLFGRLLQRVRWSDDFGLHLLTQSLLLIPPVIVSSAVYFVLFERPFMQRDWPQRFWRYVRRSQRDAVTSDQALAAPVQAE
jgi:peptidoglycan/LPS O-acetylase OafA/YrhL